MTEYIEISENGLHLVYSIEEDLDVLLLHFGFYDDISLVRSWTILHNCGDTELNVEYVSSFALTGLAKEGQADRDDKMELWIPHNGWQSELQWRKYLENSVDNQLIPLPLLAGKELCIKCAYPQQNQPTWEWDKVSGNLAIEFSNPVTARLFEIEIKKG
jgi:hypothetical protein